MSDTPRTDAVWNALDNRECGLACVKQKMEELETELAAMTAERDACRCPIVAAYERFKHLDRVLQMVDDSDGTENTDPFHAAARDLWRTVKASLGGDL